MRLASARVKLFRNVVDSEEFALQEDVTCLVGKNESGKTAILQALYNLNPSLPEIFEVNITNDYPRWRKVRDERKNDIANEVFVEATFSLSPIEVESLSEKINLQLPSKCDVVVSKDYAGELYIRLNFDEQLLVSELLSTVLTNGNTRNVLLECKTIDQLKEGIAKCKNEVQGKPPKYLSTLAKQVNIAKQGLEAQLPEEIVDWIKGLLPKFFYFSEYSSLLGRLDLTDLLSKVKSHHLEPHERTALSLLKLVGVEGREFIEGDFEERIAELEAAANEMTNQVFEYWTQNKDIIVRFLHDSETISTSRGEEVVHKYLDIRLNDLRHQMTTNFETRSSGFRWFFSFITAFSEFESQENIVILLDEPGLGLHARAQHDFLRYIDERLACQHQVIYTTHSPFMVNASKLERVRLVEDLTTRDNPNLGAKISQDVLSVKSDTLFPLQAALGYDLAQNLFVGGENLVVEGPSDLLYITILSDYLKELGRECLNTNWTIVPVGGIEKIPTFVALLGAHLVHVTVLVDTSVTPNQRLQDMIANGLLKSRRLITVANILNTSSASIEDIFLPEEYLDLYNKVSGTNLTIDNLSGSDTIVKKIERNIGTKFDHLKPAVVLLQNKSDILQHLSKQTINRFEQLFQLINSTSSNQK